MECDSETLIHDFCNVWQADNLEISELDQPEILDGDSNNHHHHHFFIKFQVEFIYPPALPLKHEDDYLLVQFDLASSTSFLDFWAPCKRMPRGNLSWGDISAMLTKIGVPLHKQPLMLHRISACAEEMANSSNNQGLKILPMMVTISIMADYVVCDLQDSGTLAMVKLSDVADLMAIPASEPEIEALGKEIVKDDDNGSETKCMICLEKLDVGSEMMAMPCSHDFHRDCMANWLKIGNFCPHCHFKLLA